MNDTRHKGSFIQNVWRLALQLAAFVMLYSLLAHAINSAYALFSGAYKAGHAAAAVLVPLVFVDLPLRYAPLVWACIVVGVITYMVWAYICEQQWVQEAVEVEECWEEVQWYNPFSWFTAIVCTIVEVLKWVLKLICVWKWILVTVPVLVCVVVGVVIFVAQRAG